MRIALGVVAGENEVDIVLTGAAVHLLDEDTDDLVDGDDIAKYRASLKKLDVPFHVEESALSREARLERRGAPRHPHRPSPASPPRLRKASRFIVF